MINVSSATLNDVNIKIINNDQKVDLIGIFASAMYDYDINLKNSSVQLVGGGTSSEAVYISQDDTDLLQKFTIQNCSFEPSSSSQNEITIIFPSDVRWYKNVTRMTVINNQGITSVNTDGISIKR